ITYYQCFEEKHYYKEAIRVEPLSSGGEIDTKERVFDDWLKWDPISSGDGDLLLDDMEKFFCGSNKVSKTVKAIDFTSVVDNLPSHGLQIKNLISATKAASVPPDICKNLFAVTNVKPVAIRGVSEQPERLNLPSEEDQNSLNDISMKHQISGSVSFSPTGNLNGFTDNEIIGIQTATIEDEPKISNGLDVYFPSTEVGMHDFQSQSFITKCEAQVMCTDTATVHTLPKDIEFAPVCDDLATAGISILSMDVNSLALPCDETKRSDSLDVDLGVQDVVMDERLVKKDSKSKEEIILASCDVSSHEDSVAMVDGLPIVGSCDDLKNKNDHSVTNGEPVEDVAIEEQTEIDHIGRNSCILDESLSGKFRVKQKSCHRAFLFPFKHLLNPVSFKKKARKV
ncbi:unnamed protein product, partial [Ilex paraguariensis]